MRGGVPLSRHPLALAPMLLTPLSAGITRNDQQGEGGKFMTRKRFLMASMVALVFGSANRAAALVCSVSGVTCGPVYGGNREAVQCVPSGLGGSTPRPLVIGLHGGGLNPDLLIDEAGGCRMIQLAKDNNFVALFPKGSVSAGCVTIDDDAHFFWNDCRADDTYSHPADDDLGFIRDTIDAYVSHVGSDFKIDPNKVYVWGQSNGGMMTYRVGRQLSDRVAAIAVVIANEPAVSACNTNPLPITPTPTLIMNGTEDPLMPDIGGEIQGPEADQELENHCVENVDTRGEVASTRTTAEQWMTNDGCNVPSPWPSPTSLSDLHGNDGENHASSTVDKYNVTSGCDESSRVTVYSVLGGGHRMPEVRNTTGELCFNTNSLPFGCKNADITAADEIWSFFSGKTLGTTVHVATAQSALVGTLAGSLAATYNDDSSFVTVGSAVSPAASFTFKIGPRSLTSLNALVRTKDAKSTGTTRKVYFYNVNTAQWVLQSSSAVGTAESEVQFQVTTGLTNYRDASGNVQVAVEHSRSSQTTTMSVERILFGVNQ